MLGYTRPTCGLLELKWAPAMPGEVYELRANRDAVGHEQRGRRYAVIVHSDALVLSTVLAAPTSTGSWTSSFHPEIDIDGHRTKVLVEQLQAIDPDRRLATVRWGGDGLDRVAILGARADRLRICRRQGPTAVARREDAGYGRDQQHADDHTQR